MKLQGLFILLFFVNSFSQITIDYNSTLPVPYHNPNGYGHNAFGYESTPSYQVLHRYFNEATHNNTYPVQILRLLNILSYRTGVDYAEKIGGHPYDTEKFSGDGYNFTKIFQVIDELYSNTNLKLLIEYGFMPQCMALEQYVGSFGEAICSPPKSYDEWENVIYRIHAELINRYGSNTINSWFFGVWNEPNYDVFWKFSEWGYDGFIRLYDIGNEAIRNVPGSYPKTGGPDNTAVLTYSKQFVQHTKTGVNYANGNVGSETNFFTNHKYSVNPRVILREAWQMAKDVKEIYPDNYYTKEIWTTECAPTGDMWAQPYVQNEFAACWWLSLIDMAYSAADISGKFYLPRYFLFHGDLRQFEYRSIGIQVDATNNNSTEILKTPLFNLWEMMTYLNPTRLQVLGCDFIAGTTDINNTANLAPDQIRCFATKSASGIQILLYHFDSGNRLVYNKMDDGENPEQSYGKYKTGRGSYTTQYLISGIPFSQIRVRHFVIDETHSNVFAYKYKYNNTNNFLALDEHDDLEQTAEFTQNIYCERTFRETITLQENSIMLILIESTGGTIPEPVLAPKNLRFVAN